MATSSSIRRTRRRIALALAGASFCAAAGGAQAATYIWTTGNYTPGVTSPSPLAAPDILSIETSSNKFFLTNFTNGSGQVDWHAGDLYFGSGAVVTNNGLWRALGNNVLNPTSGGGSFVNNGTFRKETGTGTTTVNLLFTNNGVIDTQSGTLRFTGNSVFNAGTSFTGAGVNQIAGAAAFNGGFASSNLDFASGTYTGTGAVLQSGAADFLAGTFTGDWTVGAAATLNVSSASNKFIGGSFTNDGTVGWSDGDVYFQGGASVTNSGSWIATGDDSLLNTSGGGTFHNDGLFRKAGGTGITAITAAFVNTGTIDAASGTIRFNGGGQVFNDGTAFTGAGVNLIAGSAAFNGGISSTNLDFAGSVYTGTGAVLSGAADFLWGTFTGDWTVGSAATLNVSGTSNKFIGGSFANDGTVNWSDGDVYFQGGASVTNSGNWIATGDNGLYPTSGGGTFHNDGLFQKTGGTGITAITAAFVNAGTIDAASGTIRFNGGGQVFNDGTVFTGAGVNLIAGSAAFNGGISSTNLDFAGATYTGTGAVLSGTADFLSGTFAGDWTIGAGATLNVGGTSNKFIGGSFTNDGTVGWSAGDLYLQGGATVTNNGTVAVTGNNGLYLTSGGGTLVNNGVIEKTGGAGTTTINVPLANNGLIDVRSGTIALPGNFVNDGTLAGSGAYSVTGTLTNAGIIAPGDGGTGIGTLTLNGNFAQTGAGLLDIQFGTGGLADLFLINGNASLDGMLGLTCVACTVNVGDIFTLLDATGSLSGAFANVTTSGFNSGFAYSLLYDSVTAQVQLRVDNAGTTTPPPAAVPEPASWLMMILGFGGAGLMLRRRAGNVRVAFA